MPEEPVQAGILVAVESEEVAQQPQVALALGRAGPLEEGMQRGGLRFPFGRDLVAELDLGLLAREVLFLHARLHVVQERRRVAPRRPEVVAVVQAVEPVAPLLVGVVDQVAACMDRGGRAVFGVGVVLAAVRDGLEHGAVFVLLPVIRREEVVEHGLGVAVFAAVEREDAELAVVLVVRPPHRADVLHVVIGRGGAEEREDAHGVLAPVAEQQDVALGPFLLAAVHPHGLDALPAAERDDDAAVLVHPREREEPAVVIVPAVFPPPEQDVVERVVGLLDPVEREEAVRLPVVAPVAEEGIAACAPAFAPVAVDHREHGREEQVFRDVQVEREEGGTILDFPEEREEPECRFHIVFRLQPPERADEPQILAHVAQRDEPEPFAPAHERPGEPEGVGLPPNVEEREHAVVVRVPVCRQRPALAVLRVPGGQREEDRRVVALLVVERADGHAEIVPVDERPQDAHVTAVHGAERPDVDLAVLETDRGAEVHDGLVVMPAGDAAGFRGRVGVGIPGETVHAFAGGAGGNEQGREKREDGEEGCFQVARIHGSAFCLYRKGVKKIRYLFGSVNITCWSGNCK